MYLTITRRVLLSFLAGAALSSLSGHASAKDGGNDGGGHGGDDGGGDDHGGDDHGGDDHGGGDKGKKRDDDEWSQDKALRERELGRVIPLRKALDIVESHVPGRVIDIVLLARGGRPQYRVKVRRANGVIQSVRLDARTGRVIGFLGF